MTPELWSAYLFLGGPEQLFVVAGREGLSGRRRGLPGVSSRKARDAWRVRVRACSAASAGLIFSSFIVRLVGLGPVLDRLDDVLGD